VRIEERFTVALPPAAVYREVNDVASIGSCIAGVKEIEVRNQDESRWKLEVSAGFMAMTMDFDARIVERREPEYVGFAATGQNVTLSGHIAIVGGEDGGTNCAVVIDAEPKGPLAPLVEQMGRGVQQQLARKTINNVRTRLTANGETAPLAAEPAGAPAGRAPAATSRVAAIAGLAAAVLGVLWLGWRRRAR
jgi:carbon monoxide dehydrogenase subunit G